MKNNNEGSKFRFKKGASIGEPDAESDARFLSSCFVDTGDYRILADCNSPHRIIVGRTGTGKSALIYHLKKTEENVIELEPEALSLNYLSNSDLLSNLEKAGVKLDLFYTLLWRHVITVELLRYRFNLINEEKTQSFLTSLLSTLRKTDQQKERALAYLRDWGDKFWQDTEYRVKEVTEKLETDLKSQLGGDLFGLTAGVSEGESFSKEKKIEVISKAQKIVNSIQLKALSDVMKLLSEEVFNDDQQNHYIVIDKLDENWVDNTLRYRLIRSLIETVKYFRICKNVKIVIALRVDLLQDVFDRTRDAGFQEEKYESLFLQLRWDRNSLESLLNKRIESLVKEQYTNESIKIKMLFPESVGKITFLDFLLSRTMYRPRDAISFINECLKRSEGRGNITAHTVMEAESEYSAQRIDSIGFEWFTHYPFLKDYLTIFERMPPKFKISTINKEKVESLSLKLGFDESKRNDPVAKACYLYINGSGTYQSLVITIVRALYHVGLIGIKTDTFTSIHWSFIDSRGPTDGQIKPSSIIHLHQMVWTRLGIVLS